MVEILPNYYIGFEGPIGAGKTTLAKRLSEHTQWHLLLEAFDENEFLADFYKDRVRWALPMQLSFLAARHQQLAASTSPQRTHSLVADYTYAKDEMFARLLLTDVREWRLYDAIRQGLTATASHPDLVVFLDAPNAVLLERIRLRARSYEAAITGEYLNALRQAYRSELLTRRDLRFLEIDTAQLDLSSRDQMRSLWTTILSAL